MSPVAPLAGLRVLVTRPAHQVQAMSQRLRKHGAIPIEFPVIEIVPVSDEQLAESLQDVSTYDWAVLTSVNTVSLVGPMLAQLDTAPKIAVIGDATASGLKAHGLTVDLVPPEFVAESVLEELERIGVSGARVLLPRAEVARTTLPDGLRDAGAHVDVVPVYQTRKPQTVDQSILEQVIAGNLDVITFTSPSTVRNLLDLTGGTLPSSVTIACIGPVTASSAIDAGIKVDVIAQTYSVPGLVEALIEHARGDT